MKSYFFVPLDIYFSFFFMVGDYRPRLTSTTMNLWWIYVQSGEKTSSWGRNRSGNNVTRWHRHSMERYAFDVVVVVELLVTFSSVAAQYCEPCHSSQNSNCILKLKCLYRDCRINFSIFFHLLSGKQTASADVETPTRWKQIRTRYPNDDIQVPINCHCCTTHHMLQR